MLPFDPRKESNKVIFSTAMTRGQGYVSIMMPMMSTEIRLRRGTNLEEALHVAIDHDEEKAL